MFDLRPLGADELHEVLHPPVAPIPHGAPDSLGRYLPPLMVTEAMAEAIEDEATERGVTKASVARQALILGLRQMGRAVTYS